VNFVMSRGYPKKMSRADTGT